MAKSPEELAHLEWLGYVQPVGLVVSIPALLEAQCYVNKNIMGQHARFLGCLATDDAGEMLPELLRQVLANNPQHVYHGLLTVLMRLVYEGGQHAELKIPARKGYLFDPDRYPFLEGRVECSEWSVDGGGSNVASGERVKDEDSKVTAQ